jgi:hypothetical protein
MQASLFNGREDTSGLTDGIRASFTPRNFLGVSDSKELNLVSVDYEAVTVDGDFTFVASMDGIVLKEVTSIVKTEERIVHGNDFGIWVIHSGTANETADTAKSIDTKLHRHDSVCF